MSCRVCWWSFQWLNHMRAQYSLERLFGFKLLKHVLEPLLIMYCLNCVKNNNNRNQLFITWDDSASGWDLNVIIITNLQPCGINNILMYLILWFKTDICFILVKDRAPIAEPCLWGFPLALRWKICITVKTLLLIYGIMRGIASCPVWYQARVKHPVWTGEFILNQFPLYS